MNIELNVGGLLTPIEFADADGFVIGRLKINLTDIRMVGRLKNIEEFFNAYQIQSDGSGFDKMTALDAELEEKFSYLLGYDCRDTLFAVLPPTAIFEDGEMFAIKIITVLGETITEQVKAKAAERAAAIAKYTAKHQK